MATSLLPVSLLALLAWPLAGLAQSDPDLIHACRSAPRGGTGGVLREVAPGEACRPGETPVAWPGRTLVLRDATGAQVGTVAGMPFQESPVVILTVDGVTFGLGASGQRLTGSAPAIGFTELGCSGTAFFPAALVTGPLPPVFAGPDPTPPGPTVQVVDTSTTLTLTPQSQRRQSTGACTAGLIEIPPGAQDAHPLRAPIELFFVPPFTLALE